MEQNKVNPEDLKKYPFGSDHIKDSEEPDSEVYKIIERRLNKTRELLNKKGEEYSTNDDKLHNFNVAARMDGITPSRALHGMLLKHLVSYRDILDKIDKGEEVPLEMIDEKLGDIIAYFCLQEATLFRAIAEIRTDKELMEIEEIKKEDPWNPMDTAPKDGTEILVKDDETDISLVNWGYTNAFESEQKEKGWIISDCCNYETGEYMILDPRGLVGWKHLPK